MKIVVIGAGYVGLTTGACLAQLGHTVICTDIDVERIQCLNRGEVPIYEPGLSDVIDSQRRSERLLFSNDVSGCAASAECVFIAVGTPSRPDGDIDLSYVEAAAGEIARDLQPDCIVVMKSTVMAGTARRVAAIIAEIRGDDDIAVASNPEFLREGTAICDFMEADRIVLGADDPSTASTLLDLYAPLRERDIPFVMTSTVNAELIKYAANAFLALKIGFINDVADLCERIGGDITAVAEGIGMDRRIGRAFLNPGPGFGGSCFPKDTRAFAAIGRQVGVPQSLIEKLIEDNESRKEAIAHRVLAELQRHQKQQVAVLGTAFKADTDDVRESSALTVIPLLLEAGVTVCAHDPKARHTSKRVLAGVDWKGSPYEAAKGADLVLILTEWSEYRTLDLERLSTLMRGRTIMDYRNLFTPEDVASHGLRYLSVGRSAVSRQSALRTAGQAGAAIHMAASPA